MRKGSRFKLNWSLVFGVGFFVFIVLFFWNVLRKQVNVNYIDFGDGSYLYESWMLSQGKWLYGSFLIPHPPLLFMWGAILMKISSSVLFIRSVNLILYLLGAVLLFRVSRLVFKNTVASIVMSFFYFLLPFSIIWWSTFTTEVLMRFLVLVLVNILLPLDDISRTKAIAAGLVMSALAYLKYSSAPILLFICIFFLLYRKRNMMMALATFLIISTFAFIIIQLGTNGSFLHDTILIRKYIPAKDFKSWFIMTTVVVRFYIGFGLVNLVLARRYSKAKNYDAVFLLCMPFLYFVNVYITYFEGTFNYIYYPIEPFMTVGISLVIASFFVRGSQKRINRPSLGLFVPIILSVLTSIYLLQTANLRVDFSMDDVERNVTNRANTFILTHTTAQDEILSPPYFAFLSKRRIVADLSDSFLWMMSYLYNNKDKDMIDRTVFSVVKKIETKQLKVVILDYHLKMIPPLRNAVERYYKPVDQLKFVWNEIGEATVYVPREEVAQ